MANDKKKVIAAVDPKTVESRRKRFLLAAKLIQECRDRGVTLSPTALYIDDEVFGDIVTRDTEAEQMIALERDIATAITFLRWRQKQGLKTYADLNYDEVEY